MLFNSIEFIFIFLPICIASYYITCRFQRPVLSQLVLIVASLSFYSWWRPANLPILLFSAVVNYVSVVFLLREETGRGARKVIFGAAILFNICFLGYFKYTNFGIEIVSAVTSVEFDYANIILPLGISFFTFQKIALLVDVYAGSVKKLSPIKYLLFISFFPQLLAGPIVHHRDVIPQFDESGRGFRADLFMQGVALFIIGLTKKVGIADTMAVYAIPVFEAASDGVSLTFLEVWGGALSYTLQLYFDFSGYCDMAVGLALLFGIRLPFNFNSPLKAASIIDLWQRWHMTLTRFLAAYIFNPIVLRITRRRVRAGRSIIGRGTPDLGAVIALLVWPIMLTMVLAGLWHGAGATYIFFGFLHGAYLSINHLWRLFRQRVGFTAWDGPAFRPLCVALTFIFFVFSLIFFRTGNMDVAWSMLWSMVGGGSFSLPVGWGQRLGEFAPILGQFGFHFDGDDSLVPGHTFMLIGALLAVVSLTPNSQQIVGLQSGPEYIGRVLHRAPRLLAIGLGVIAGLAVLRIDKASQFLYFQF